MQTDNDVIDTLWQQAINAAKSADAATTITLLQDLLQQAPGHAGAHCMLAAEWVSQGKLDEGEASYARALVIAPEFVVARFQLGLLLFSSSRVAMAMLIWRELLSLPENNPYRLFTEAYIALANDAFDEAIRLFESGKANNPDNPPLNHDADLCLARLRELMKNTASSTTSEIEESGEHHVLLSNYLQFNTSH